MGLSAGLGSAGGSGPLRTLALAQGEATKELG